MGKRNSVVPDSPAQLLIGAQVVGGVQSLPTANTEGDETPGNYDGQST